MKDKSKTNLEDAVKTLGRWLREDYWKIYCEPQYRFVRKAFTVERYLGNNIETSIANINAKETVRFVFNINFILSKILSE